MLIKIMIQTDVWTNLYGNEETDYETRWYEHEINANDICEYLKEYKDETIDITTTSTLLDYNYIDLNELEDDSDFQDFMSSKYEDEFYDWLRGK